MDVSTQIINETVRIGDIKDLGLGYEEGVIEAMKSFTNAKTFSLP